MSKEQVIKDKLVLIVKNAITANIDRIAEQIAKEVYEMFEPALIDEPGPRGKEGRKMIGGTLLIRCSKEDFINILDIDYDKEMARIRDEMRLLMVSEELSQSMLKDAFRGIGYDID